MEKYVEMKEIKKICAEEIQKGDKENETKETN